MRITPTFQGEFQFRRYSDTSTQGQQVVFAVQDREALEAFVGLEGKRFMAVLVQIGDDEQPVESEKKRVGPYCYQAVVWCQSPEFRQWILDHTEAKPPFTEADARAFILYECAVGSRKDLDLNASTQALWQSRIAGPYRKWRIARGLE